MHVQTKLMTAEEFEQSPLNEKWTELIRGEVVSKPPTGFEHGALASRIGAQLVQFVEQCELGEVYAAGTGFILSRKPDTVRAPDAAFVTQERAAQQKRPQGYFEGAPDLAVEVNSPSDTDDEVSAKVLDYFGAGTRMIWVVSPRTRTVTVYRSLSEIQVLTVEDTLDGGDVLPGFRLAVRELFGV